MKIKSILFLVFSLFCTISNAQSDNSDFLIWRLKQVQPSQYRLSIENISKVNKKNFKVDGDWQSSLAAIEENRALWIEKIAKGDKAAISESRKHLAILDKVLLSNPAISGKKIVAVRRVLNDKARSAMGGGIGVGPSNFQNNSELWNPKKGWNNEFVELNTSSLDKKPKVVFKPTKGLIISDPEPSFDGERILYSSIGTNDRWHLFELDLKKGTTRQVTPEAYRDFDSFDGCYTPDGRYIFCSTGTFLGLPCTNGGNKMCGLFMYDPKSGNTRQLTYDQDSNWGPVVMNNGQILYQRWEYADLPHANSRLMFTMNPDGTTQQAFYGTNSYFPTSFFGGRPIPGNSSTIVGIATGHHSVARSGRMMIIDTRKGRKEAEGVIAEIPYYGKKVDPIVRDRLPDGVFPQFLQPYPLNDKYFLVSMKPTPDALWGVYLVDIYNNMTPLAVEEGTAYLEPIIVEKKATPPIIPDRINLDSNTATVFLQDVYMGDGLKDIPKGTIKKLRIGSYSFSPLNQGGLLGTIGMDGPWDVKRILGTVDVENDGSAMFKIPANTPIFVQPLDEEGKAIQVMRSWFTGMPGETLSCIGCHEDKNTIPSPKQNLASKKKPQEIMAWYGKDRGFSYRHEVQPVLDRYCVGCHSGAKPGRPYLKGDKWITDWTSDISGRAGNDYGGHFTQSYADLHRYVRRPGIESDMEMLVPMDVHADQTELIQILKKGHYGVTLDKESMEKLCCWIDFNAPFHGNREAIPNFKDTQKSCELKEKYRTMFGAPERDLEWLPELKENTPYEAPVKPQKAVGDTVLEGWPWQDPSQTTYSTWDKAQNKQISLGQYQKSFHIADGVTLDMIKIPAGTYIMGSTHHPDEMPQTIVTIDKPFWIGKFEITNKQFRAFDPAHRSRDEHRHGYQFGRKGYSMDSPEQPAVRLSWQQAMKFCEWLTKTTGQHFSLPTEAEWEWACRSGSATDFWFGNVGCDFSRYANLGDIRLKDFAACTAFKFYESTKIIEKPNKYDDWIPRDTVYDDGGFISDNVGRYIQNAWDLYDMHGNVWEWTRSMYKPYPYKDNDGRNDVGDETAERVARGGSWYDRPFKATSSFRMPYRDYQKVYNVGFRVVMYED